MRTVVLTFGMLLLVGLGAGAVRAQAQADSTYTVEAGDTLYSIAQEIGVSVRTLMAWNDLDNSSLQVGQTLRVRPPTTEEPTTEAPSARSDTAATETEAPPTDKPPPTPADTAASAAPPPYGQHTVAAGETFVDLALRLGTTADSLFALNDSTTAPLAPGRTLRLPRRFGPPTHRVEDGQTLYSVAGTYGVSVRALKAENELESDSLRPGRRLQIPRRAAEVPDEWAAPDSTGRVAVYPSAFAGRLTASGTAYDPEDLVVSHPSLPFGSVVLLSTRNPARHTFARVIDRGPVEEGVLLDVSAAVARALAVDGANTPSAALRVVWVADGAN
ncbi:MAG: LysM peptidoglycan-binding domain-containing protein [Salinivenus sp.]